MEIRTPLDLGAAVRGRRRTLKMSQATVARNAGVSRPWLSEFEAGKPTVEVSRVLAVLSVLDFTLDLRAPGEPPPSPERLRPTELLDLDAVLDDYTSGRNT
jgi:transcriptional regulator with XRE-family HTH domain